MDEGFDIKEQSRRFTNLHNKSIKEQQYLHNRAIEYAMQKLGMKWDSNRQRLSFYEYFEESLSKEPFYLA